MNNPKLHLAAGLVFALAASQASATLLVLEDFDYTGSASPGTALGQASGGTGWVTNWSGSFSTPTNANGTVVTGGLDNNANPFGQVGNHMRAPGGASYRQFSTPTLISGDSDESLYFSFMIQAEAIGSGQGDLFKLKNVANTSDVFTFGFNTSNQWTIGGAYGSGGGGSGTNAAAGSGTAAGAAFNTSNAFFVVGKIVTSTSGNDTAFVQIFGDTGDVPLSDSLSSSFLLTWSVNRNNGGATGTQILQINTGGSGTSGFIDGIRIGTTYADVATAIPEPSAFAALAGLAGLGCAALRRRRHA